MHVRHIVVFILTSFLFFVEIKGIPIKPVTEWNGYHRIDLPRKCCTDGYLFNEELNCVKVLEDNDFSEKMETEIRARGFEPCKKVSIVWIERGPNNSWTYTTVDVPNDYCLETTINGTQVLARCSGLSETNVNFSPTASIVSMTTTLKTYNETTMICDNENHTIFWGADSYMVTNISHMIFCVLVVALYSFISELRKGIHNHAILQHNISLLGLGCVLTFLCYFKYPLADNTTILLWLLLQFFTVATVFWLNVICYDMTLCITRFRWTVGLGVNNERDNYRRFFFYAVFGWGGALLPSVVAGIFDYTPGIPKNFPLKPNYIRYCLGPNPTVNLYFFAIPLVTLFCNNVLFIFTTYKIIRIQRSTKVARKNQNVLTKKYFLFLRLYLIMGAPWFFGSLLACLNNLVIIKMCRLIQPILWLFMLLGRKNIREKIAERFCCCIKSWDSKEIT